MKFKLGELGNRGQFGELENSDQFGELENSGQFGECAKFWKISWKESICNGNLCYQF